MELHFSSVLLVVLSYVFTSFGDKIESAKHLQPMMEHRVTLPCKFTATNKDWMFIRWKRTKDGETVNIASMQNKFFEAEWSSSAPEYFRDHVELQERISEEYNEYSLNLVIDGLICQDVGVYTCEVFTMSSSTALASNTTLEIKAHPGMPTITADTIEVKENDTFKIECNSDVGVPAHSISWWYTLADAPHIYQKVSDGFEQEDTLSDDNCKFNAMSTLSLQMTSDLDGATYVCSTTPDIGEDGKPEKSDEVKIVLYGKTTTTQSTRAPSTQKSVETTETSSATTIVSSLYSAVLAWCLVTVFNSFFVRTT